MFPLARPTRTRLLLPVVQCAAVLVALLNAAPSAAQGTGRSLDIQPGARQNGMGAAGVALFGNAADALWWNPALLGFADEFRVQVTRARLVPGLVPHVYYHHVSAATALFSAGGIGASYTHLDYGSSEGYDERGRPTGSFESSEESVALALGFHVHRWVAAGATLKKITFDLAPGAVGETYAVDIGGALRIPLPRLTFGLGVNFQNQTGRVTFVNEDASSPLSRNVKVGASLAFPIARSEGTEIGGVAVIDFNHSQITSDFEVWNGGFDIHASSGDQLRVALRTGYYFDDLGEIEDPTFGVGARLWMLSVDAAWIPQARNPDLDRVLKLTAGIHYSFGQDEVLAVAGN